MPKAQLPMEVQRQPLDYAGLISVLDLIDGELVVVRMMPRVEDEPANLRPSREDVQPVRSVKRPMPKETAGLASLVGTLSHVVPARYGGDEFAIGAPYLDRYPPLAAGGVLFLNPADLQSANLTTFDGNDYFSVLIEMRHMVVLINDGDSTAP